MWFSKTIEYADFAIRLSGKFDALTKDNIIIDIKRTQRFYASNYNDESTIQHDLYMYLKPDAKHFAYKIGAGKTGEKLTYKEIRKERKPDLHNYIVGEIEDFILFLHKHGLLEAYFEKYVYIDRRKNKGETNE